MFSKRHPAESNLRPLEQLLSVAAGACLLRTGWRDGGLGGCLQLGLGAALTWRGLQGYSPLYEALEIDTRHGVAESDGWREAHCSLSIARPAKDLYDRWRDLERLPATLSHVEEIRVLDERRSHWVVGGPLGARIVFESCIEEDVPNERIAWRSSEDAELRNEGVVEFQAEGEAVTRVTVRLRYLPPAGALGEVVAKLLGRSPSRQLAGDLERFKQEMEGAAKANGGQRRGRAAASAQAG